EQMLTDTHLALKLRNLFHHFLRRVQGLFLPEVIQLAHDIVLIHLLKIMTLLFNYIKKIAE
ncbi:hypothetical protein U5A85_04900, partial [Priestia megaterium]